MESLRPEAASAVEVVADHMLLGRAVSWSSSSWLAGWVERLAQGVG